MTSEAFMPRAKAQTALGVPRASAYEFNLLHRTVLAECHVD